MANCWKDWECDWTTVAILAGVIAIIGGLIAVLVVAFAVVYPPKATADDSVLTRFELSPGSSPANSTISYNATVKLSLYNPNIYRGISYAAMATAFSFNGSLFDESTTVREFEQGARKTTTVRVMVGGVDRTVKKLSAAGVAEFDKEKEAGGKFAVEVRLDTVMQYKGRKAKCPLVIVCPLQMQLVDPEVAATAFQKTKCTILRAKTSGC